MLLSVRAFIGKILEILVGVDEVLGGLGDHLHFHPRMLLLDVGLAIVN